MLIYINYLDLNKVTCVGIKKKILAQCRALKKNSKKYIIQYIVDK